MSARCALALDIGGTNVAAAIVDSWGDISDYRPIPVHSDSRPESALGEALDLAEAVLRAEEATTSTLGVVHQGIDEEDSVEIALGRPGWVRLSIPRRVREWCGQYPHVLVAHLWDIRVGVTTLSRRPSGPPLHLGNRVMVTEYSGPGSGCVAEMAAAACDR